MKCLNCNTEFQDGLLSCPVCGANAPAQSIESETITSEDRFNTDNIQVPPQGPPQVPPQGPPQGPPQVPPQGPPPYQQQYNPYQSQSQAPKSSSNAKWIVIGLLGTLLLCLLGFLGWKFLDKSESNNSKTATEIKTESNNQSADDMEKVEPAANEVGTDEAINQPETVVVERIVEKPIIVETQTVVPAPTKKNRSYSGGRGRWPFTSTRYLDPSELYGMSAWDKKIMRNEIYARHGYIFQTNDMINYFNSQPWYTPISKNVSLSKIEQYNVQLIKSLE